jgi:hypothetical protein
MRIATWPCQTVPLHQQVPSCWNGCDDAACPFRIPGGDQHLIEHDLVENGVPRGAQAFRKAHRMMAGVLNKVGDARAPKRV